MHKEISISVSNVSKTFKIPHEKVTSLRSAAVGFFNRKRGYEEFKALDDVSFEVKKGEFFGIIGRNGSGKSTLLKILAGIYRPDSGKITINGRVSPFLELGIGFNPELSGRDNIYLNATVLGMTKREIDEKFGDIVAFSELERFIDQKLKNYSSGMQVRLAFSVSIHANREILLMDEVLAVGDVNFQQKCLKEFNRYRKIGKTVILVSHDIGVVENYCDRALLLREGKVAETGEAIDVVSKYVKGNIEDEEQRLDSEEKHQGKKEDKKNKAAAISGVEFFDQAGKARNVYTTGEDIVARISYVTKEKINKPVFGVAVHNDKNVNISGPNTKTSKFPIDSIEGEGHIDFILKNNPLFEGRYFFTVSLYGWECITPFDFHDRQYSFQVKSTEDNQFGICKLDTQWKK